MFLDYFNGSLKMCHHFLTVELFQGLFLLLQVEKNLKKTSGFQMYAEALNENEKLKSRLQDSKQELARIRSQLEKVTQVPGTGTSEFSENSQI